jgi:hypothetical protein
MMEQINRFFPAVVVLLFGGWFVVSAIPPADAPDQMHLQEFAELPIVADGRVKPLDTLARNSLFMISNRQAYKEYKDPKDGHGPEVGPSQPAIKWLLDVMTMDEVFHIGETKPGEEPPVRTAEKLQVFRVENDQLVNYFQLPPRPEFWRYSTEELGLSETGSKTGEFMERAAQAASRDPKDRDLTDQKILELDKRLQLYRTLRMMNSPRLEVRQPAAGSQTA